MAAESREGSIPAFVMTAASSNTSNRCERDLESLLCEWVQAGSHPEGVALLRYRTLKDRQPRAREETYYHTHGHILDREVGQHASGDYIYDSQLSTASYSLLRLRTLILNASA
jgi:hypothetical protein